MAAKKSTAKKSVKKAPVKKTTSKKVTKKTAAAKKNTISKKTTKKVEKKTKPISATAKPKNNNWAITAFVIAILVLALLGFIGWTYLSPSDDKEDKNSDSKVELTPVANGTIKLLVVEDPSCVNCQVDLFVEQVKTNLIPELVVEKVDFSSAQGEAIVASLDLKQVPAYFFSEGIDKRDDWAEQLSGAFIEESLDGQKYYMLNPQFIPNKVMVEAPTVLENAVIIGDVNAPVTIIEFTDFECPFCAIAEGNAELVEQFKVRAPDYVPPIPKIKEEYVESGQVRIVFYNNPIASLHPQARTSHLAVLCANEQNMFEEYADILWTKRSEWAAEADRVSIMKSYAQDLSLDQAMFDECLDTAKYDFQIKAELALSQEYGISGTPAFFVGKSFISGAQSFEVFDELIKAQLAE